MGKAQTSKKRSNASDFKKGKAAIDLDLPSGNVALVRRRGLDAFMREGLIPNSLMALVQGQLDETEGKSPALQGELQKIASDTSALADVARLADAITVSCVIDPAVLPIPEEEEDRDEDLLYVDEVDMDDKLFIFSWVVGGTKDIERFREEQTAVLASISGGEEMEHTTE